MDNAVRVVVIGQGYVGLPVSIRANEVGFDVVALDLDEYRINQLKRGKTYVEDISNNQVKAALQSGRFLPTTEYSAARNFDYAVISVPTPLRDARPDLSYIESAAQSLAPFVRKGATIILESTTYPGTTEEILIPILEQGSGLKASLDFFVGYSPERIDPGNKKWGFVETPKVVAGVCPPSLARVRAFFDRLVNQTVPVNGVKEAELSKLLENTFRHVNIALVNELAIFANRLDINVWEAIDAASTKPFGFMKFTPGPGVGGHCLPVDPSYLSWQVKNKLGHNFRFVELANDINDHQPDYVVQRFLLLLNKYKKAVNGAKVLLVGLSYKKNTGDVRHAPSLQIIELLKQLGAELYAMDGFVDERYWPSDIVRVESNFASTNFDGAIIITDHDGVDLGFLNGLPILDTRNTSQELGAEIL